MATEEHPLPAAPGGRPAIVRLVRAYPSPRALPLPSLHEAVGRDWLVDAGVADARVSAQHLAFRRSAGALTVADAGSKNGTFVDGRRLAPSETATLEDGSLVRIGRTIFVVRDNFQGSDEPSEPISGLVGPFGLRGLASALEAFQKRPTKVALIEGETGTGKERTAQAVACAAGRSAPVTVNLAAVPAGVFESQLFGHAAGAFSGAVHADAGLVGQADRGAIFMDEIGELPLELQPKLLRLLDSGEVQPVGGKPRRVDVLFLAATNRDLSGMVEKGTFRRDLWARLSAYRFELPPLRDRCEDIFSIAEALVAARNERFSHDGVEVEAVERLLLEPWPANVRGLNNALQSMLAIEAPPALRLATVSRVLGAASPRATSLTLALIEETLATCRGVEAEAARRLGISRGKLRRWRQKRDA